jgi:hypothetical protein
LHRPSTPARSASIEAAGGIAEHGAMAARPTLDRRPPRSSLPLWPLALLAGLLPAVAALIALWLSVRLGLVPACNPFFEGCVSVSRAARHGLPNHLFRTLALPAAALQALTWLLAARWLRDLDAGATDRSLRALMPLGVIAGIALALYGAFLGTEGQLYRWLRQYGTVVYFGFTCLCMLIAGGAIARLARARMLALPSWLARALVALGALLVTLGLANALSGLWLDGAAKDRVENVTEWWGALIFTLVFVAIAAIWKRSDLRLTLSMRDVRA